MAFYFCDFTSSCAMPPDVSVLGDWESEAADSACDRFGYMIFFKSGPRSPRSSRVNVLGGREKD